MESEVSEKLSRNDWNEQKKKNSTNFSLCVW